MQSIPVQSIPIDDASLKLSEADFLELAHLVTDTLGIKMSADKQPMLEGRLLRRVRQLGLTSLSEYRKYLFESPDADTEFVHFMDAVTTNKTDFFREPRHFDYLAMKVLPQSRSARRFQLWCAGCSSGEEPYTLAMVLSEYGLGHSGFEHAILATDVSTRVLAQARSGIYDVSRIEGIPDGLRTRYLLRSRDESKTAIRISGDLRKQIRFHRLNLMEEQYPVFDDFDAIFFRNVLIYFDRPTQEAVVNRLCRHLLPGGHMFIGHSESLNGLTVPLTQVASAVYRKPA